MMALCPRISIIIPTYNHAQFLRKAIDSIRAQTFQAWEAIIINNFSEDNTVEIVDSYSDSRIRLVNYSNYGIIAASRNYGLSLARAPYIAFLDSDDFWYPEKLASCLDKISEGYDLVCHAEIWSEPGVRRRAVYYGPESKLTYKNLLFEGNCISTSAVMVRREKLMDVDGFSMINEFVTAEDYDLWLRLACKGARMGIIDEVLGEYLIHENNQSRFSLRNMHAVMEVFKWHLGKRFIAGSKIERCRREALIYYSAARGLQDSHQYTEAWPFFFKAVRLYPREGKFYLAMLLNAFRLRP